MLIGAVVRARNVGAHQVDRIEKDQIGAADRDGERVVASAGSDVFEQQVAVAIECRLRHVVVVDGPRRLIVSADVVIISRLDGHDDGFIGLKTQLDHRIDRDRGGGRRRAEGDRFARPRAAGARLGVVKSLRGSAAESDVYRQRAGGRIGAGERKDEVRSAILHDRDRGDGNRHLRRQDATILQAFQEELSPSHLHQIAGAQRAGEARGSWRRHEIDPERAGLFVAGKAQADLRPAQPHSTDWRWRRFRGMPQQPRLLLAIRVKYAAAENCL